MEDINLKSIEVTKLFKDTFDSDVGRKCLTHLKKAFVDSQVYRPGQTFEETAFREGRRDVIQQILREVNRDGR